MGCNTSIEMKHKLDPNYLNKINEHGNSILIDFIHVGEWKIMNKIKKYSNENTNYNIKDSKGISLISWAVFYDYKKLVKYLLQTKNLVIPSNVHDCAKSMEIFDMIPYKYDPQSQTSQTKILELNIKLQNFEVVNFIMTKNNIIDISVIKSLRDFIIDWLKNWENEYNGYQWDRMRLNEFYINLGKLKFPANLQFIPGLINIEIVKLLYLQYSQLQEYHEKYGDYTNPILIALYEQYFKTRGKLSVADYVEILSLTPLDSNSIKHILKDVDRLPSIEANHILLIHNRSILQISLKLFHP